jgi:HAD superfamily hydrolase (TIGR01509 family)
VTASAAAPASPWRLEVPAGDFQGFIFDLDGTLAESMVIHHRAWRVALEAHGASFEFGWELFNSRAGMSHEQTVVELNVQFGLSLDPDAVAYAQRAEYERMLAGVTAIDEVVHFARTHAESSLAVASGGDRRLVERTLELIGVRELFPVVVVAADVPRGKPEPDIFLLAASRLGVAPDRCVVFEDGALGILAAERAGMRTVLIPGPVARGAAIE